MQRALLLVLVLAATTLPAPATAHDADTHFWYGATTTATGGPIDCPTPYVAHVRHHAPPNPLVFISIHSELCGHWGVAEFERDECAFDDSGLAPRLTCFSGTSSSWQSLVVEGARARAEARIVDPPVHVLVEATVSPFPTTIP